MRFTATIILSTALFLVAMTGLSQAQEREFGEDIETQRLAQTGLKFLSVSLSPRAAAMGDAITAEERRSTSILYNPAGAARMDQTFHVSFGQTQWISDISYNGGTIAVSPSNGQYGVVGLSLRSVDYGEFLQTIRADNQKGFRDMGTYSPSALAVGLSYSRVLTDRFAVGANFKWARQNIGEHAMDVDELGNVSLTTSTSQSAYAVDFGVIYQTGYRDMNFAFNVRNLAREQEYHEEEFELPLTFRLGFSMDATDLTQLDSEVHAVRVGLDAERPRDYHEQVKMGAEYSYQDFLHLRAGYVYPTDEQNVTLGGGISFQDGDVRVAANYAYTQFGIFGTVNRVGMNIGF